MDNVRPTSGAVNPPRPIPNFAASPQPIPFGCGETSSADHELENIVATFRCYAAAARAGRFSEAIAPGRRLRRYGFNVRFTRPEGQEGGL